METVIDQSVNENDATPDNGKLQSLVDHCLDLYKQYLDSKYRKATIELIERSRKVYEQANEKASFPWTDAANYISPLNTIAVDNIEPRQVASIIGTDPIVLFDVGDGEKDDVIKALESDFNRELMNVVKVKEFARDVVHTRLIDGTYYCATKYGLEEKVVKMFKHDANGRMQFSQPSMMDKIKATFTGKMPPQEPMMVEEKKKLFEGAQIESIPFSDIFIADDVDTIAKWEKEPVIRKVRPTYAELQRLKDSTGYMNIGKWLVTEKTEGKISEDSKTPSQTIAGIEVGKEVIECLECHLSSLLPVDTDVEEEERTSFEEENIVVTIALKSEIIVRLVRQVDLNCHNEKLIKRVRLNPETGKSYGSGVYAKTRSIQDGCSDIFNHILNCAILTMMPYFFYDSKSQLPDKTEVYPGKGIPVDDVNGIKFPTFNLNPQQLMSFVEFYISMWERATSISDPQIGRLADRKETATAILTAVQEGSIKQDYSSDVSKEEVLSIFRTVYDLYYKNMPYNKKLEVNGQQVLYPRDLMYRGFKFALTGSTGKANKLIDRKEAEDVQLMYNGDQIIDQMKIREDVLRAYGKHNAKDYFNPELNQIVAEVKAFPELFKIIQQVATKYVQQKQAEKAKPAPGGPPPSGFPEGNPPVGATTLSPGGMTGGRTAQGTPVQ